MEKNTIFDEEIIFFDAEISAVTRPIFLYLERIINDNSSWISNKTHAYTFSALTSYFSV